MASSGRALADGVPVAEEAVTTRDAGMPWWVAWRTRRLSSRLPGGGSGGVRNLRRTGAKARGVPRAGQEAMVKERAASASLCPTCFPSELEGFFIWPIRPFQSGTLGFTNPSHCNLLPIRLSNGLKTDE